MGKIPPPHMIEIETAAPPAPPPSVHWAVRHPMAATLFATIFLVLTGAIIVIRHSAANPPEPGITAWGGDINTLIGSDYTPGSLTENDRDSALRRVQDNPPYTYVMPTLTADKTATQQQPPADSFDYSAIISSFEPAKEGATPPKGVTDISYAFPPADLFTVPAAKTARTPVQQALYNYGNEVGSNLESYEQQHPDQARVLKDQIEDPGNAQKAQAVIQLGRDLENIGTSLLSMEDVPPAVGAAHIKVAKSYQKIGQNLALVPAAKGTDAMLSAINTYNASADVFAKDFVTLVSTFSTYGVTFGPDDAGSVFTFTYSSGM